MVFAMKSSTTTNTWLLVVLLSFRTSVAVLPTILDASSTPPPLLTIFKVQEAIQSASMIDASLMVNPKLDSFLQYLVSTTTNEDSSSTARTQVDLTDIPINRDSGMDSLIEMNQRSEVVVDVLGQTSNTTTLKYVLLENGYQVINCYMNMCSLYLRADQIEGITQIPEIVKINLALSVLNRKRDTDDGHGDMIRHHVRRDLQGSVTSQAVRAMFVDTARTRYNHINGTGIIIGILSDSFDCRGTQAQIDISSGDLPPLSRINVLADLNVNTSSSCSDEGRAMMQLVYDIVPGANFAFRTVARGLADFAAGIIALADAGCQIIVDDIQYFAEPFFQDGIIALAVNEVVSRGVSYFSSAGNSGNTAWDGAIGFTNSSINAYNGTLHSFGLDTAGSHVVLQPFRIVKSSAIVRFLFQWDEPFVSPRGNGGSRSNVDIYVLDESGKILSSSPSYNTGSNPFEVITFNTINLITDVLTNTVVVYVAIVLYEGPPPTYMKIISLSSGTFSFSTGSEATSFGHPNSASAAGVGAANYINTPNYGVSPPRVESFSSSGGIPIFFDADSNRLSVVESRRQPRFTGPDGVSTTFFSGPTRTFFGTSASAPNVAGVAALMLQLHAARNSFHIAPANVFQILESTAIDMTSTIGFDFRTGYGFVNASRALDTVSTIVLAPIKAPTKIPTRSPLQAPIVAPAAPITAPIPIVSPIVVSIPNRAPDSIPIVPPAAPITAPITVAAPIANKSPSSIPIVAPVSVPIVAPEAPMTTPIPVVAPNVVPIPNKSPTSITIVAPVSVPIDAPVAPMTAPIPVVTPIDVPASIPIVAPVSVPIVSLVAPLTTPIPVDTPIVVPIPNISPASIPVPTPMAPVTVPISVANPMAVPIPNTVPVSVPIVAPVPTIVNRPVQSPRKSPVKTPTRSPTAPITPRPFICRIIIFRLFFRRCR